MWPCFIKSFPYYINLTMRTVAGFWVFCLDVGRNFACKLIENTQTCIPKVQVASTTGLWDKHFKTKLGQEKNSFLPLENPTSRLVFKLLDCRFFWVTALPRMKTTFIRVASLLISIAIYYERTIIPSVCRIFSPVV